MIIMCFRAWGSRHQCCEWAWDPESWSSFGSLELGAALHYAAKLDLADRVKMLSRRGSEPDVLDLTGHTALEFACSYGRENTATLWSQLSQTKGDSEHIQEIA